MSMAAVRMETPVLYLTRWLSPSTWRSRKAGLPSGMRRSQRSAEHYSYPRHNGAGVCRPRRVAFALGATGDCNVVNHKRCCDAGPIRAVPATVPGGDESGFQAAGSGYQVLSGRGFRPNSDSPVRAVCRSTAYADSRPGRGLNSGAMDNSSTRFRPSFFAK